MHVSRQSDKVLAQQQKDCAQGEIEYIINSSSSYISNLIAAAQRLLHVTSMLYTALMR